ncbi:hypothetical protein BHE74_00011149 [Ensete ventricosum]|nr:hypothetical protein BHE74_00011149 [Ensete ventricosum]
MVPQRRVFRVCASKLASNESIDHQYMGAVYHRGRSQIASTSESHGGDLIIQRCKTTDSRAMGLAAPWYRRGGTSVESSIPCSHGRRALVVKGAKEVENAKANSKYQDRVEGQRPRNFIRPRMGEVEYPSSLTYPVEELYIGSLTLQRKLMKDNSCQILTIGDQYY